MKRVYGRRSNFNVPVKMNQDDGQVDVVDLISYDTIAAAAILAVYAPSRRIRHTSVTETINEL